jgi:malonate transporter
VVLTVLGDAASFPLFLIVSFHSLVMFTTITVLMEASEGGGRRLRSLPLAILKGVAGNPIIVGLVLGLAVNRLGLGLPPVVDGFTALLGGAAIPAALFATGAALRQFSFRGALPAASLVVVVKGLVHPLLVWVTCVHVFALEPLWTAVAVVLAATPVGVNAYVFATRYQAAEGATATAVAVSTALSMVTVTIALWVVGVPA